MSLQTTLFTAAAAIALAVSAVAAQAAPQPTAKLERVVITGKAVRAETQVTAVLPRVVINGHSEATLLRQATLAAAKTSTKRI